jgi:catechol 2,3-dioxygenase-like lactoylglutathione lyase family enzyme
MTDPLPAHVTGLDHVVLKVADPEVSVEWYGRVLGLQPERLEEWRRGEAPFVSLRIDAGTIIDLLADPPDGRNVDHMALVVDGMDLDVLAASGQVEVVVPPMRVWGARGWGHGLYIADPDGHTVELRTYPGGP